MDTLLLIAFGIILGGMALAIWSGIILAEQDQNTISFCQRNGFTDFTYTNYSSIKNQGFCYNEVNDTLEKQDFFITKTNKVLIINE